MPKLPTCQNLASSPCKASLLFCAAVHGVGRVRTVVGREFPSCLWSSSRILLVTCLSYPLGLETSSSPLASSCAHSVGLGSKSERRKERKKERAKLNRIRPATANRSVAILHQFLVFAVVASLSLSLSLSLHLSCHSQPDRPLSSFLSISISPTPPTLKAKRSEAKQAPIHPHPITTPRTLNSPSAQPTPHPRQDPSFRPCQHTYIARHHQTQPRNPETHTSRRVLRSTAVSGRGYNSHGSTEGFYPASFYPAGWLAGWRLAWLEAACKGASCPRA
ncbi:uncharacterized protein IWZ02DRAFT_106263 [Phyllosticta citriasiana]|uniref:uncharacterized protein n=1 Tax=Phyllosticta citriasiana TaxID=595635 RepID=UPI0030FD568F